MKPFTYRLRWWAGCLAWRTPTSGCCWWNLSAPSWDCSAAGSDQTTPSRIACSCSGWGTAPEAPAPSEVDAVELSAGKRTGWSRGCSPSDRDRGSWGTARTGSDLGLPTRRSDRSGRPRTGPPFGRRPAAAGWSCRRGGRWGATGWPTYQTGCYPRVQPAERWKY